MTLPDSNYSYCGTHNEFSNWRNTVDYKKLEKYNLDTFVIVTNENAFYIHKNIHLEWLRYQNYQEYISKITDTHIDRVTSDENLDDGWFDVAKTLGGWFNSKRD